MTTFQDYRYEGSRREHAPSMTLWDRLDANSSAAPALDADPAALGNAACRSAIVDIGSNSIRMVVYDGPARLPFVLFNEKVMAGLGAGLDRSGKLENESMERALSALQRFVELCIAMQVDNVRCVATAAVRDASNGQIFIDRAAEIGLKVRGVKPGSKKVWLPLTACCPGCPTPMASWVILAAEAWNSPALRTARSLGQFHCRSAFCAWRKSGGRGQSRS